MQTPVPYSGHRGGVYALAHGKHGTFLSAGSEGTVVRWQPGAQEEGVAVAQLPRPVFSMCEHDGTLVVGLDSGSMHVLDLDTGKETRNIALHTKGVFGTAWTADGNRMISIGGDGTMAIWSWPTLVLLRRIPLTEAKLRTMAVSPDGHWLAVSSNDGRVHVLDTTDFNELISLEAHANGAYGLAFHPQKPVLITGGRDGRSRAWKMDGQWKCILEVAAHQGSIYGVAFAPDGKRMATASRDKTIKLWDATSMDLLMKLDRDHGGHTHSVNALLWLADGTLVTAGDDKRVLQWPMA